MNIDIHAKSPEEYKVVELKPVDGVSLTLLPNRQIGRTWMPTKDTGYTLTQKGFFQLRIMSSAVSQNKYCIFQQLIHRKGR
jgi:hypothetical protein